MESKYSKSRLKGESLFRVDLRWADLVLLKDMKMSSLTLRFTFIVFERSSFEESNCIEEFIYIGKGYPVWKEVICCS